MIIASSNVGMSAVRNYQSAFQKNNSTFRWNLTGLGKSNQMDSFTSFYKTKEQYAANSGCYTKPSDSIEHAVSATAASNTSSTDQAVSVYDTIKSNTLSSLLDLICKLRYRNEHTHQMSSSISLASSPVYSTWNVLTTMESTYEESETTEFNGSGTVTTKDGREISFDVNLSMTRSFKESYGLSFLDQVDQILTDPLVINLDSAPASLSDQTFLFDLDNDGKQENIAMMNSSSGFLAIDKNHDGIINNGSELFGPGSGNGFNDLKEYDSDHNGWIDEADDIFTSLLIWTKDSDGNDKLMSLKEAGVGALCVDNTKSPFSIKDSYNQLKGMVQRSGVYLREDGTAGSMQQIDL
jgi:hypothetical protein